MSKTDRPKYARNKFAREEKGRKRAEAAVRQELASKRTPEEQIARLDLGNYVAASERAKLAERIVSIQNKGVEKAVITAEGEIVIQPKEKKGSKARRQSKKDKKANAA